jgi:hypothetical protein
LSLICVVWFVLFAALWGWLVEVKLDYNDDHGILLD